MNYERSKSLSILLNNRGVGQSEVSQNPPTILSVQAQSQAKQSVAQVVIPSAVEIAPQPKLVSSPVALAKMKPEEVKVVKRPEPLKITSEEEEAPKKEPMIITDSKKEEPVVIDSEAEGNSIINRQFEDYQKEQGESSPQKAGRVEEMMVEFREEMHKEMMNMHVEMIRQFQIQIVIHTSQTFS